jgi:hypothetical protein
LPARCALLGNFFGIPKIRWAKGPIGHSMLLVPGMKLDKAALFVWQVAKHLPRISAQSFNWILVGAVFIVSELFLASSVGGGTSRGRVENASLLGVEVAGVSGVMGVVVVVGAHGQRNW